MRAPPTISRSRRFSSRSLVSSSAWRNASKTFSRPSGFSRKSNAPARVASTASAMVPCPEIMITGASLSLAFSQRSRSTPAAVRKPHIQQVDVGALRIRLGLADRRTQADRSSPRAPESGAGFARYFLRRRLPRSRRWAIRLRSLPQLEPLETPRRPARREASEYRRRTRVRFSAR